jgi:predicted porin
MKKFIVALAIAGTALAASAQVSLSGVVGYGITGTGSNSTFRLHDSKVVVNATEKIGNLVVTGQVGINGLAQGSTPTGQDAFVAIDSPLGEIKAGQLEVVNGIMGRGLGGAPVIGSDGVVLAASTFNQVITYTAPKIAGVRLTASTLQDLSGIGSHDYVVGASYDIGGLSTGIDYTNDSKRVRATGSYDLKFVKVGAGWSFNETGVANSYTMGLSAPVGPLLVGAAYSKGDGNAVEAGAAYSLSKRTTLSAAYRMVDDNSVVANNVNTYRVRVTHAF